MMEKDIPYCTACQKIEDEIFIKIRDFIYNNPTSNASIVSEGTGIPVAKILDLIREGRIELIQ